MRAGGTHIVILKSEPPSVGNTEKWAGNGVPVSLGIGNGRNSEVLSWSRYGPSTLGDPNRLGANCVLGVGESLVEERGSVLDTIGLSVLEVWVGVESNPVTVGDNLSGGRINPGSPSVDVADGNSAQRRASKLSSDLLDIGDDDIWANSDTSIGLLTNG